MSVAVLAVAVWVQPAWAGPKPKPVNTSPPTISGIVQEAQTLNADRGTWSGETPITYSYQWQRCDAAGTNCGNLAGATAQAYKLARADVGRRVRVRVTAKNAAGSASATSAATSIVPGLAPLNTSPPTIAGSAQEGQTLTASPGDWSGATPISFAYRWQRCAALCSDIVFAAEQSYTLTSEDVGSAIRVVVSASNSAGSSSAMSAPIGVVQGVAPVNTSLPSIAGSARDGQTLSADPGGWSGTPPISHGYQWQRCDAGGAGCADVAGATAQTYGLISADVGATIRVAVMASNTAGSSTATSAETDAVVASAPDPVIAAAGDIACDPAATNFNGGIGSSGSCRQRVTSDLLVNAGLAAVLPLGDVQYDCAGATAFNQSYDPSWGRVKAISRPVVGNHEYETSGTDCDATGQALGYFGYFGDAAGHPAKGYYSYDVGSWHIIALNSNDACKLLSCSAGSPQEQWLRADLAEHPAQCTLAYWHAPRFASGSTTLRYQAFWDDLYSAGADVVLNGHLHDYERFAPQSPSGEHDPERGIRQFVVGTGGAGHAGSPDVIVPRSEVFNKTAFGVLKLTLHASSYDWTFVPEAGKTFTDSGTTACH